MIHHNENELKDMLEALQDAMYKLECAYNSDVDDRNEIVWHLQQLTKLEELLVHVIEVMEDVEAGVTKKKSKK